MTVILRFWRFISRLGVDNDMPKSLQQKTILGNQVSFTAGLLTCILSINFIEQPPQAFTYIMGSMMCLLFLIFNGIRRYRLARFTILIVVPILIVIGGYFSTETIRASQKLSLITMIVVPLVLFGITEKRAMYFGLAWTLICILTYDYIHLLVPRAPQVDTIDPEELRLFESISLLLNFLVFSTAFIYLQRLNYNSEWALKKLLTQLKVQNQRIEKQRDDLESAYKRLEILNLRTRMNPHFLYNVLNSVQHFITINDKKSGLQHLTRFSRLMRKYLNYNEHGLIVLSEELELLTNYLDLEMLRFEGRFDYVIHVDDAIDCDNTFLPFLLIQPFAENAVLHGLIGRKNKGVLKIDFHKEGLYLICLIEDNGIGRKAAKENNKSRAKESKGIELSTKRLKLHYNYTDDQLPVEILDLAHTNGEARGTAVKVRVPIDE